ncbi:MAG: hypothetical protein Q4D67_02905 [Streptococcus minor]|nr:hypothetical protein [Streptococcus minor]
MIDTKIPLYHCNHESVISKLMNGQLVVSSHPNDDIWGGRGMYFWDNFGNAIYWRKQKPNPTKIIRCVVSFNSEEDLMDLTDYEVESRFAKLLSLTNRSLGDKPIGKKIDYLCDKMGFKIVRFFGEYEHTPQTNLINDTNIPNKLTNKVKIIYCIKNNDDLIISDFKECLVKE